MSKKMAEDIDGVKKNMPSKTAVKRIAEKTTVKDKVMPKKKK